VETFDRILQLQRDVDERIQSLGGRAFNAQKVVEALYENPVTIAEDVKKVTGLTKPSVYTLIRELERLGILYEMTGAKSGRIYSFKEYINLFT